MMDGPPALQFLITPEETLILNAYRDLRRVHTDGKPRPSQDERWPPTTWGDSIGRWEGDTLVIDTIDVRAPREYLGLAVPLSTQAHYTKRLRKAGPDRIEGEMTIEDPATPAKPWTVELAYVLLPDTDRMVLDSYSNNRTGFEAEVNTIEPPTPQR